MGVWIDEVSGLNPVFRLTQEVVQNDPAMPECESESNQEIDD